MKEYNKYRFKSNLIEINISESELVQNLVKVVLTSLTPNYKLANDISFEQAKKSNIGCLKKENYEDKNEF